MFRFDKETLGLFGTARQKQRRQQNEDGWSRESQAKANEKLERAHRRPALHSAIDLRYMDCKVVKVIDKAKLAAWSGGEK